jgi:hypothetical protein
MSNSSRNPTKNVPGISRLINGNSEKIIFTFPYAYVYFVRGLPDYSEEPLSFQDKIKLAAYHTFPMPGHEILTRKYVSSIIKIPESPKVQELELTEREKIQIYRNYYLEDMKVAKSETEQLLIQTISEVISELDKEHLTVVLESLLPLAKSSKKMRLKSLVQKARTLLMKFNVEYPKD